MPTVVIGTAGHIDHGKTSLLRALTGIDADRLPEERARGMTIDVGYAHLAFDDGVELDFVDVPGHDRLIGNMLVGAGEIDAAMLVVAADDGPRPQTLEHLQLLDALGIRVGLAVVTKIDVTSPARTREVVAEVQALLARTSLAGARVLAASSVTGDGITAIRDELRRLSDAIAASAASGPFRLAIDRVFAPMGRGVVVTGTLRGGSVARGAWLQRQPGGELVRVRSLQVHGAERPRHDGGRVAFNITGDVASALRRGDVLARPGELRAEDRLLVQLARPAELDGPVAWPPRARRSLRLHAATAQANAALRPVGDAPDVALLTLDAPVATFAGDRMVLRDPARGAVVAGVRVLDLAPPFGAGRRRVTHLRVQALANAVASGNLEQISAARLDLHGVEAVRQVVAGGGTDVREVAFAPDVIDVLVAEVASAVAAHHRATPLSSGLPLPRARTLLLRRLRSMAMVPREHEQPAKTAIDRLLDALVLGGTFARRGDALRDPTIAGDVAAGLVEAMARLEAALSVAAPPALDEAAAAAGCPPEGVRALAAEGRIVRLTPELAWATPTYHHLAGIALDRARLSPLTPAAFRDATGTSRKFVMVILEDLDRRGILVRTPEGHLPGPRAPR